MKTLLLNAAASFASVRNRLIARGEDIANRESGASLAETLVITGLIVVATFVVIGIIVTALKVLGNKTSTCISKGNSVVGGSC